MTTNKPSPSQMLAAFLDHGVDLKTYKRWDTRGGRWGQNGGGLDGITMHHTATPSATGSSGAPTLYWCAETYDWAISNMLIGRGPGDTYLLSANPSYHTGDGGPFPAIGINRSGNVGHLQLFGIEIDDAGKKYGTLTDYQIENAARVAAALQDLCGWPDNGSRIITHQAWTDGSYGVNPSGPSPHIGRKGDTIHRSWREYPGSSEAEFYNPNFWRKQAEKYVKKEELWDGTIPKRSAVLHAQENRLTVRNKAAWRVACRLYDLGFTKRKPRLPGNQNYPKAAVKKFQKSLGWKQAHGNFSPATQRRLFGKLKP
jgi:hypothetical protein